MCGELLIQTPNFHMEQGKQARQIRLYFDIGTSTQLRRRHWYSARYSIGPQSHKTVPLKQRGYPPGKGFWKFNSSLLHDTNYVEKINPMITESAAKYKNMSDKGLVWELIKLEIRNFTIPYCIDKKRRETAYENDRNKKFEALFRIVNSNNQIDDTILNEFHAVKNNLDILAKNKARGIIFRSKCQWIEEGEKNTAYFLRLEKCNYVNKLISKIKIDEDILTDPQDILNEERSFYNKLHSLPMASDQNTATSDKQFFLENNSLPQLNETDKASCENAITERELLISIKAMKNGKSPGCDGLTSEFYKFFWTNIKTSLLNSINYGLETGRLSTEQRRGILSLLQKKDKDRLFLKKLEACKPSQCGL